MPARGAARLRGSATLSRRHCRHRSRGANEDVGSRVDRQLVGHPEPVQRVAKHESGEKRAAGMEIGRMPARCGQAARGRGHQSR